MAPTTPQYPGVTLPLRYLRQEGEAGIDFYPLGSFVGGEGTYSELLQVREVAMMVLMDRLTDKPNWHEKVFDDTIVAKWREEALSQDEEGLYREILGDKSITSISMPKRTRFITGEAFDFCIAELRTKAAYFKDTGLIFTLNYGHNTAIKSDSLAAFERLRAVQAAEPDWHPWTDDKIQDLVHPSLYPFVYGKTPFIHEEVVGVADAVDKWSGKGSILPKPEGLEPGDGSSNLFAHLYNGESIDRSYWSTTYQWLPANLAFQEDGTVRFTSYINNLHPNKYPEIYRLVEKLIDTAIPAWDRVLSGRAVTEGGELQKRMCAPEVECSYDDDHMWEEFDPAVLAAHEAETGPVAYEEGEVQWRMRNEEGMDGAERQAKEARIIAELKWKEIRDPILPRTLDYEPVTYEVRQSLRERFKDSGLQVIVKMASIELTPEKPDFPVGGWHIEGQMNEHIVATALYYLDSENITPTHLSFRMITDGRSEELEDLQMSIGQDMYHAYERIWGTGLGWASNNEAIQHYGSVETREGRLLAFPNVFQHHVSSFSLQDRTKPGHRRFIALWLVDPHCRIISTANVPPQQFDWWAEAVFGAESKATAGEMPPELFQLLLEKGADKVVKPTEALLSKMSTSRLPAELMQMIRRERVVPDGLMTADEAREHRLALMEERSAFVQKNRREWSNAGYSFCEH
ncbi:hypothetical protein C8A03DRAFT_14026 [Achaetomium macrosporum]|uniref:Uncharacterized protein n=1 Tax=Achaetomium macrosporum TaxID=79813 RepID=A0AAN7CCM8_9PEZI|nr:hypothetical protein C8A03DRAFT_14026 [Achaetomium macrosporum]